MIEDSPKAEITQPKSFYSSVGRAFPAWRRRRLHAIEIAEGALLADIGVIFQLLIKFLPVGSVVLQLLVPVIFAVLVLRRGFYVGCMSLCVALFVVCIVMGPGGAPFFLLESGAGLFLGLTMRHRLGHLTTCVAGIFGGGGALWMVLLFYSFVGGGTSVLLRGLHQSYASTTAVLALVFRFVGLGAFWQHTLFPPLDAFMQWGFQNWLLLYYLLSCVACVPLVVGVYLVVNFFLRLLGYRVRPFPGYLVEGWLYALGGGLFRLVPQRVFARLPALRRLKSELRRLNRARLHQQRAERGGRVGV
jgi:hypothetical protein